MKVQEFHYAQAFDRNLGWLTPEEQKRLQNSRVAIAGMGGAGGVEAQALARLGVGGFKIADQDTFELSNFNRQTGATTETLGESKVKVLRKMILSINPEAQVETFQARISKENIDSFLQSVDLVIDGIDFFEHEAKFLLFQKSFESGLPAITSCPLGFGASLITFSPHGMRARDYFDLREGMNEMEQRLALAFGLSPSALCLEYMNPKALNLEEGRASSVFPGLLLVGALTAAEAVKILTGKERVYPCPHIYQIDLLTQQVRRNYYSWGMGSPWLRLKRRLLFQWWNRGKKRNS